MHMSSFFLCSCVQVAWCLASARSRAPLQQQRKAQVERGLRPLAAVLGDGLEASSSSRTTAQAGGR